jgi:hypothetical protein
MPRMKWLALLLALLLSVVAAAKPKKPASPRPQASTAKAPKSALVAAADEIARQVAALRGLPLKAQLQRGVLTRDEIGVKLKERFAK